MESSRVFSLVRLLLLSRESIESCLIRQRSDDSRREDESLFRGKLPWFGSTFCQKTFVSLVADCTIIVAPASSKLTEEQNDNSLKLGCVDGLADVRH